MQLGYDSSYLLSETKHLIY